MSFKKKFKRFRKEWFYTGVLAFLTTCLIGLILFSSFIISNADGSSGSGSYSFVEESDLIKVDDINNYFSDVDLTNYKLPYEDGYTSEYADITNITLPSYNPEDIPISTVTNVSDFDTSYKFYNPIPLVPGHDVPYVLSYDYNYDEYVIEFYYGGFVTSGDNIVEYGNYNLIDDLNNTIKIIGDTVYLSDFSTYKVIYRLDNQFNIESIRERYINYNNSGTYFHSGALYGCFSFIDNGYSLLATNIPINVPKVNDLSNDFGVSCSTSNFFGSTGWSDCNTVALRDFNYMNANETTILNVHPLVTSDDDDSNGTDENNLVIENCDWIFKNSNYSAPYSNVINTGSVYPNGNCTFTFIPNDYQIENASNFDIVYGFQFDLDVDYQNWGSNDIGPFKQTSKLLNTKKNLKATFNLLYGDDPNLNQSLTGFIDSGNSRSFTFQYLFDHLSGSNNDFSSLTNLLNQMKELDSVEYNKFNLTCTAFLDSGNTTDSSGKCEEWYNPMSKKGYTIDKSGGNNPNPYVPGVNDQGDDDVNPKPQTPGPGGNEPTTREPSTSEPNNPDNNTTSGNGNVVINNNPTFNNNVSGGSSGGSNKENESMLNFYNTFSPFSIIFGKLVGDNKADTDAITEVTGANPFLRLMSQVFGFLPSELWVVLLGFLTTCLGIVVVAFVLRIILDLL